MFGVTAGAQSCVTAACVVVSSVVSAFPERHNPSLLCGGVAQSDSIHLQSRCFRNGRQPKVRISLTHRLGGDEGDLEPIYEPLTHSDSGGVGKEELRSEIQWIKGALVVNNHTETNIRWSLHAGVDVTTQVAAFPVEHREPVVPKIMSSDYLFTLYSLQLQLAGADPDRGANASARGIYSPPTGGFQLTLSGDLQETSSNVRTCNTHLASHSTLTTSQVTCT